MCRTSFRALFVAGSLLAAPAMTNVTFVGTATASGAYFNDLKPTLPETCRELGVAFLSVAQVNRSAPDIGMALRLYRRAMNGCRLNPRESIFTLQLALHLVTPE
jgi:hypothetical protein